MHLSNEVNSLIPLTVGKAVIAIAWADGVIQPEEIECIKNMLEEAPDIPGGKLEQLNDLLQSPIQPTEREIIMDELIGLLHNREERNFAVYWLDKMVHSKGKPDEVEKEIHDQLMRRLMGETQTSASPFCLVKKKAHTDHLEKLRQHTEEIMTEWIIIVRDHIKELKVDDKTLKEMIETGLVQGRIVLADNRIDEDEVRVINEYFVKKWSLSSEIASKVVKLLLAQSIEEDEDIILLCEELRRTLSENDLEMVADSLFNIATAKDQLGDAETNEIISITASLGMGHIYFENRLREFAPVTTPA